MRLGHPRVHLRRTGSTNEQARQLAIAGAPHGTLVTATEQTAGRGRQGRVWSAPPGSSLLMSLVLRDPLRLLPLAAAVAVCDIAGPEAKVKWPNDVILTGAPPGTPPRKLAGILVEGRPQAGWAVLGIGLNVAVDVERLPHQLRQTAASLNLKPSAVEPMLEQLLGALERRLNEPPETTLGAWRARDALRGREISWDRDGRGTAGRGTGGRGTAEGVDEHGHLLIRRPGGALTALSAGEVHLSAG